MNSRTFILSLMICFWAFSAPAQEVKVVKFDAVKKILENDSERVTVVNFWATWCAPCVKELPYFEELATKYDQVDVILINLDFVEGLEKVKRFIKKKSIKNEVILLDEIDYNTWIDRVNPNWSGAIPATLIIGPHAVNKKFLEGELTSAELEQELAQIL